MNATSTFHYVGWKSPSPNERDTLHLLYGCVFTIWLCSWSAVHLNAPADSDSDSAIFLRKIKWMGLTILAPEFVLTFSLHDYKEAWDLVEVLNAKPKEQEQEQELGTIRTRQNHEGEPREFVNTLKSRTEVRELEVPDLNVR
jgi:hypothetical protein